jgi:hypothetical protein
VLGARLLTKPGDAGSRTATPNGLTAGHRRDGARAGVGTCERIEVDVGHAVAVGREERTPSSRSATAWMRPPVGVSSPVSTHSTRTAGQSAAAAQDHRSVDGHP